MWFIERSVNFSLLIKSKPRLQRGKRMLPKQECAFFIAPGRDSFCIQNEHRALLKDSELDCQKVPDSRQQAITQEAKDSLSELADILQVAETKWLQAHIHVSIGQNRAVVKAGFPGTSARDQTRGTR